MSQVIIPLKTLCYFSQAPFKGLNKNSCAMELGTRTNNFLMGAACVGDVAYLAYLAAQCKSDPDAQAFGAAVKKGELAPLAITSIFAALWLGMKVYGLNNLYKQATLTKNAINFLQDRLIGMGSVVRSVSALEDLNDKHPIIGDGLVSWQHKDKLLCNTNADFTHLVNLLKKGTFEGEASFFSLSGRVLATHKLMEGEKNKFAGAIELMGELDACLSVAKLYKQFEQRRVGYCFSDLYSAQLYSY